MNHFFSQTKFKTLTKQSIVYLQNLIFQECQINREFQWHLSFWNDRTSYNKRVSSTFEKRNWCQFVVRLIGSWPFLEPNTDEWKLTYFLRTNALFCVWIAFFIRSLKIRFLCEKRKFLIMIFWTKKNKIFVLPGQVLSTTTTKKTKKCTFT